MAGTSCFVSIFLLDFSYFIFAATASGRVLFFRHHGRQGCLLLGSFPCIFVSFLYYNYPTFAGVFHDWRVYCLFHCSAWWSTPVCQVNFNVAFLPRHIHSPVSYSLRLSGWILVMFYLAQQVVSGLHPRF